jgi:enamine deaminase RidA (YjgF/YER057c/UK114 family)
MLFLGGLIGWNADQQFETDDFLGQVDQTLANIVAVLKEGGAGPEHLVRLTWYVVDKQEYLASLPNSAGSTASIWAATSRRWRWCRSRGWSRTAPASRSRPPPWCRNEWRARGA